MDNGWKPVETEPETVAVNGNGHHDDLFAPMVELAPAGSRNGNGHEAVLVNGNSHHEEAPEPQQSLFSWAEFMAEAPVKPKCRNGKPQPASLSMFEWAMEQEREREEESVGAAR